MATQTEISVPALLALYIMEMAEMGASISIMAHGIDTETRERMLSRFTAMGFARNDSPDNRDKRGVDVHTTDTRIDLWLWP
jgi:hypothetical protein